MSSANDTQSSFLIVGAGAIGGMVGARLAAGGFTTGFYCRAGSDTGPKLMKDGLTVLTPSSDGTSVLCTIKSPSVYTSLSEGLLSSSDGMGVNFVIIAVKSFDTEAIIKSIQHAENEINESFRKFNNKSYRRPAIVCLQNGVDNEVLFMNAFGEERVIAGTITTSVSALSRPCQVLIESEKGLGFSSTHPSSTLLLNAITSAGMKCYLYNDAASMKWSKMLGNLLSNATSAICDMTPLEVFNNNDLYQLEINMQLEALRVMRALKAYPVNLPGVPSWYLAFGIQWLPSWSYRWFLTKKVSAGRGRKMPSFHIDLVSGASRSEVEFLHGAVSRHGKALGIATPCCDLVTRVLTKIHSDRTTWDLYRKNSSYLLSQLQ